MTTIEDFQVKLEIRQATRADRDALLELQHASMRVLGRACYDEDVIEAFLAHVGTMDDRLIDDGTYFAAFIDGMPVGCGGWSGRTPAYASQITADAVEILRPKATVRSVFVHPAWSRCGIARLLMARLEHEIMAAGHDRATLAATLTGVPFYRRLGYRGGAPLVLRLPHELLFVALNMEKRLHDQIGGTAARSAA